MEKLKNALKGTWGRRGQVITAVLLAMLVFLSSFAQVKFHGDENNWILTSPYGEILAHGDFRNELWDEGFWTLDAPPLGRYIIYAGLRAGGIEELGFNLPWDFSQDEAANTARGSMPGPQVLWWSRLPMALLGALSAVLVFLLAAQAAGWWAGWLALALFLANPFLCKSLSRAMSESPLLAFTMLTAGAGFLALRAWRKAAPIAEDMPALQRPFLWFLAAGALAGLAGASKLNGLALAASGAALAGLAAFVHKGPLPRNLRFSFAIRTVVLLVLACLLFFVLLNPFLYTDPLGRMVQMYKYRVYEMGIQIGQFPQHLMPQGLAHLILLARRIFGTYFALPEVLWPLVMLLSLWGIWGLGTRAWKWLRGEIEAGTGGAASLALLVVPVPLIAVSLTTPLDWDRYYLLPVVFAQIYFVAAVLDLLHRLPFFRHS